MALTFPEMDLAPRGDGKLDELALVVPLRTDAATHFQAGTFRCGGPAEKIRDGDGVVWDSASLERSSGFR